MKALAEEARAYLSAGHDVGFSSVRGAARIVEDSALGNLFAPLWFCNAVILVRAKYLIVEKPAIAQVEPLKSDAVSWQQLQALNPKLALRGSILIALLLSVGARMARSRRLSIRLRTVSRNFACVCRVGRFRHVRDCCPPDTARMLVDLEQHIARARAAEARFCSAVKRRAGGGLPQQKMNARSGFARHDRIGRVYNVHGHPRCVCE